MVLGHELFRHHGIHDALADLLTDECRVVLVDLPGHHDVIEIGQPFLETGLCPQPLVLRQPLVRRDGQGRPRVECVQKRAWGCATLLEDVRVARLDLALRLGVDGPIAQRHTVVRVRWKTVRWATSLAISGMSWTAVAPVPMTPTRLPATSRPSFGHLPV